MVYGFRGFSTCGADRGEGGVEVGSGDSRVVVEETAAVVIAFGGPRNGDGLEASRTLPLSFVGYDSFPLI